MGLTSHAQSFAGEAPAGPTSLIGMDRDGLRAILAGSLATFANGAVAGIVL